MDRKPLLRFAGLIATALVALTLAGCRGPAGQDGTNGTNGTPGTPGTPGVSPGILVDVTTLTPEQYAALKIVPRVTGVNMASGTPKVSFELKDHAGNGIKGFGQFRTLSTTVSSSGTVAMVANYPNFNFTIAKLVPEDPVTKAPSKWVSYLVTTVPTKKVSDGSTVASTPTRPSSDNNGRLEDFGNGNYTYTFFRDITVIQDFLDKYTPYTSPNFRADLGNVSYEPSLTHRVAVQISGAARGTDTNTPDGQAVTAAVYLEQPVNFFYDFVPNGNQPVNATDVQREVVTVAKCNECHGKVFNESPHRGRIDTKYCVTCHTDQRKYGRSEATTTATGYTGNAYRYRGLAAGNLQVFVHGLHMGSDLTKTGTNYAGIVFKDYTDAKGVFYPGIGNPMIAEGGGAKMCAKCHSGGAQSDNWNTKPSRLACGTCHDNIDFANGVNHAQQTNDQACRGCHEPEDIKVAHYTENVTKHNPVVDPALANFTYQIDSASQATAGGPVTVKFRILKNGTPVTFKPAAKGMANPLDGFTGAPGFLLAWASPQEILGSDGKIASPIDYNNLLSTGVPSSSNFQPRSVSIAALLDSDKTTSEGTLSGPDNSGYYTANIVGSARVIPDKATMRAVALQGYFTQVTPAAARHAIAVWKSVDKDTVRRTSVSSSKCANCHEWFEGHGGNRVYEVQVCVMCHVPGLTTSGRGMADAGLSAYYDTTGFSDRDKAALSSWTGLSFATNPVKAGASNVGLKFPQVTNNLKDMIHGIHMGKERKTNPIKIVRNRLSQTNGVWGGAVNVINGANAGFPGVISSCESCHTYNGYSGVPTGTLASRDMANDQATMDTTDRAATALKTVNALDLVTSPFTAACASCHDSVAAAAHMKLNGGQISVPRGTLNTAGESCAVCHGAGSDFDPVKVHK